MSGNNHKQQMQIVVLGGGLGGLFTGAMLAHEGCRVTVLEQNAAIGGGLQEFRRGGVTFETGMHIMGGLRTGGSIGRIIDWLGIAGDIALQHLDADCIDSITYLATGDHYRIPQGREAFEHYLAERFPHEAAGIHSYVEALYRLAGEVDIFWLRPGSNSLFRPHSEDFVWAADQLIAHHVTDPRLRDLLGYMNPMYGGVSGVTPAYVHALINVLYLGGADRFAGGSAQLARALAGVIEQGGGQVLAGERVTRVGVTDRQVTAVYTQSGGEYHGDRYVCAIHPCRLLDIIDDGAFSRAYVSRLREVPNSYSAFSLYIVFKPEAFPYINHTCYYQDDYGLVWQHGDYDEATWPRGFMYMTCAQSNQGKWASNMIINCIMPYSAVSRWADTTTGHRGADYEQWKRDRMAQVMQRMERLHPGFADTVQAVFTSSPLTIRDYYNEPEGALYGMRKDCRNLPLSQLSVMTRVRNLLLTGQCVNLHGMCGVPLTAINTAEAILGENVIINQLNHQP